jgi:LDH2 family malate/lactate/ureidoglycolate dehydrogenase
MISLRIEKARALVSESLTRAGYAQEDAAIITDHLIDCELRGLAYGGVARAVTIIEKVMAEGLSQTPITVVKETPVSATIDGGAQAGYLVGHAAMRLLIRKTQQTGLAVVGVRNTWLTGMLSYYGEMATRENLVLIGGVSSTWRVAPVGSSESRFGTNPLVFAFPAEGQPIIHDMGTSAVMVGDALLRHRRGERLAEGVGYDEQGSPTTDPFAALRGAFMVWGGAKGSGLAAIVQMLGLIAGGDVHPDERSDQCMFFIGMRPDLLAPDSNVANKIAEYASAVRGARPLAEAQPVRMPFDRSAREREHRLRLDAIEVANVVHDRLDRYRRTGALD